jgi:hypothetical protein
MLRKTSLDELLISVGPKLRPASIGHAKDV